MFLIRPITASDLEGLMKILEVSGHGLTSLPKDREIIANKIDDSERSFKYRKKGPRGESYLFVMEEVETGTVVGVSGIIAKIGGFEPCYFYKVNHETLTSEMLKRDKKIQTLTIEKVHSGPAEICSLFLDPKHRNSQNGRFLSLSRFLYMAEHPTFFEKKVIAEMRGQVGADGNSPFWDAVGNKFMDIEFLEADYLSMKSKSFIEELLPSYPIITNLLPKEAQDVIGKVHDNTIPARRILEQEGFSYHGLVGIFEPGPVLEATLDEVRSFKESKVVKVESVKDSIESDQNFIISHADPSKEFKASLGKIQVKENESCVIESKLAKVIGVAKGDTVRFVSLK